VGWRREADLGPRSGMESQYAQKETMSKEHQPWRKKSVSAKTSDLKEIERKGEKGYSRGASRPNREGERKGRIRQGNETGEKKSGKASGAHRGSPSSSKTRGEITC